MSKLIKVILLIDATTIDGRSIAKGAAQYANVYGPWVFYREPSHYRNPEDIRKILPRLREWGASGIIMHYARNPLEIFKMNLPTIFSVQPLSVNTDFYHFADDAENVAKMAAEHFLSRGFNNFGFCGYDEIPWSQERENQFFKKITSSGFKIHIYKRPKQLRFRSWEKEQSVLANWLRSLQHPIGIFACNDDRGVEVIEACKLAGLRVPEDVAVIGVDNDEFICELSYPSLSSIAMNYQQVGYEAAQTLHRLMQGQKPKNKTIICHPTHIVTRSSSDIYAVQDPQVLEALRFIRTHATKLLQVNDVASAVAMTRQGLQKKFKKTIKHSIHEEIARVRVELTCQMLVNTNMSISSIASMLGYPEKKYISRFFKQITGVSPLEYRKKFGLP
ncbi:MAG: DNA-binding transcriptional regulator [Sedimentisphaerales bacterium]|nr:DNA-binding transcriptional regulator [Sedimentisphaerales bacterium]